MYGYRYKLIQNNQALKSLARDIHTPKPTTGIGDYERMESIALEVDYRTAVPVRLTKLQQRELEEQQPKNQSFGAGLPAW